VSDERYRELERRFVAGHDAGAEAALLVERVRKGDLSRDAMPLIERLAAGTLTRQRLLLAAYLTDPLARAIVGDEVIELAAYLGDVQAARVVLLDEGLGDLELLGWLEGLATFGPEVVARALAEGTRRLFVECRAIVSTPEGTRGWVLDWEERHELEQASIAGDEGLVLLDAWLACPCELHLASLRVGGRYVGYGRGRRAVDTLSGAVRCAKDGAWISRSLGQLAATAAQDLPDALAMVSAIRDGLVPWALAPITPAT
jgi:hypothetical protein